MTTPQVWLCDWIALDDQLPPDPEQQVFFYNAYLDIFLVASMDGLEESFKKYQANVEEFLSYASDDVTVVNWIKHRYSFTHWTTLPAPPDYMPFLPTG